MTAVVTTQAPEAAEQTGESFPDRVRREPEARLLLAVIELAVEDIRTGVGTDFLSAVFFVARRSGQFELWCSMLGFDPDVMREAIFRRLAGRLGIAALERDEIVLQTAYLWEKCRALSAELARLKRRASGAPGRRVPVRLEARREIKGAAARAAAARGEA